MNQVVDDFTADYKTIYMQYRLLRNNKESGPFTAIELKEMGLKPFDLLWTEGRGAAWQYASEINELKDFAPVVEEQPFERSSKRKEVLQTAPQTTVAVKKVKPRYRISNGQLIMVESGAMEVGTNGVITQTAPARAIDTLAVESKNEEQPNWQNIYPQWQPQHQPKKEVKESEPVEMETKYSESLDNLKKRYAEKVLGDKKESSSSSMSSSSVKQNIMAVVALVVLVAGGYIGYTLKKKDAVVANGQPAVERADIAANGLPNSSSAENTTDEDNKTAPEENKSTQIQVQTNQNVSKTDATTTAQNSVKTPAGIVKENDKNAAINNQKKPAETVNKTDNKTGINQVQSNGAAVVKANAKPDNVTASKTNAGSEKTNTASSAALPPPPVVKTVSKQISDYVSVKKFGGSGAGVQNVKLMVSNVSDFPIDLAVVDIQYFDSKGKYQKGETMYVKDINGGNNVEVRVPDSDRASSIKYKVSMVQADQKTLYMVAD